MQLPARMREETLDTRKKIENPIRRIKPFWSHQNITSGNPPAQRGIGDDHDSLNEADPIPNLILHSRMPYSYRAGGNSVITVHTRIAELPKANEGNCSMGEEYLRTVLAGKMLPYDICQNRTIQRLDKIKKGASIITLYLGLWCPVKTKT